MKKLLLVMFALLSSSLVSASPDCFEDMRGDYLPAEAGRLCHGVSDACYNRLRMTYSKSLRMNYGPVRSAQICKNVSTSCFTDMRPNGPVFSANTCRDVENDCYKYMSNYRSTVQGAAKACPLNEPVTPKLRGGSTGKGRPQK